MTAPAPRARFLALLACSYAYASFSSIGSLHAPPTKESPTGRPCTKPIGTVMCG